MKDSNPVPTLGSTNAESSGRSTEERANMKDSNPVPALGSTNAESSGRSTKHPLPALGGSDAESLAKLLAERVNCAVRAWHGRGSIRYKSLNECRPGFAKFAVDGLVDKIVLKKVSREIHEFSKKVQGHDACQKTNQWSSFWHAFASMRNVFPFLVNGLDARWSNDRCLQGIHCGQAFKCLDFYNKGAVLCCESFTFQCNFKRIMLAWISCPKELIVHRQKGCPGNQASCHPTALHPKFLHLDLEQLQEYLPAWESAETVTFPLGTTWWLKGCPIPEVTLRKPSSEHDLTKRGLTEKHAPVKPRGGLIGLDTMSRKTTI